jgi:hypothetical protein
MITTTATTAVRGDRADDNEARPPLYCVSDVRRDGRRRVVGTFCDPDEAQMACAMLRWAGADVAVELVAREEAGHGS